MRGEQVKPLRGAAQQQDAVASDPVTGGHGGEGGLVVVETPGGPEGQAADIAWLRARLAA